MSRSNTLCAAMLLIVSRVSAGDQLPGTLNFANVTGERVVQTVKEVSLNEKEVEFGDFDNDGDLDVVIAVGQGDFGQRRNKLYRNDAGVFNEVSGDPIIPGFAFTDVSRNAFLRDFNGDGFLDIWITNDGNTNSNAGQDKLYIAQHKDGIFTSFVQVDQGGTGSANCGSLTRSPEDTSVAVDFDLDGDIDIWQANSTNQSQDYLRLNDGEGKFSLDAAGPLVPGACDYTRDVSSADMNGDGTLDLLLSNWAGENHVYYNNSFGVAGQNADFNFPGSVQDLEGAELNENAMEPIDVNNDAKMDIYWSNKEDPGDRILLNTGNNDDLQAVFVQLPAETVPSHVDASVSRKATVGDFNGDGRDDLIVMAQDEWPTILRNATVKDHVLFLDWTPGDEFPNGSQHRGWHAAAFDSDSDGDIDIFLGGWANDHLFENVPANEVDENDLRGLLPPVYNTDPVAVLGHSEVGEVDTYLADDIGDDSFISVVLNGPDDYLLEVLNVDDVLLADSDRGGLGIEEAMQVTIPTAGTYKVRVTVIEATASQFDLDGNGSVGASDLLLLFAQWGTDPGGPPDFDGNGTVGASDVLALLTGVHYEPPYWGSVPPWSDYVLEVLSRTGP